jgi:hypothetical protein
LGKRLVAAAIKGSYNIWFKRCGYKDKTLNIDTRHDPNSIVDQFEAHDDEEMSKINNIFNGKNINMKAFKEI